MLRRLLRHLLLRSHPLGDHLLCRRLVRSGLVRRNLLCCRPRRGRHRPGRRRRRRLLCRRLLRRRPALGRHHLTRLANRTAVHPGGGGGIERPRQLRQLGAPAPSRLGAGKARGELPCRDLLRDRRRRRFAAVLDARQQAARLTYQGRVEACARRGIHRTLQLDQLGAAAPWRLGASQCKHDRVSILLPHDDAVAARDGHTRAACGAH